MSLWSSLLFVSAALAQDPAADHTAMHHPPAAPPIKVEVDSGKHEVIITTGPWNLPSVPPVENHAMLEMSGTHNAPVLRFDWPVDGWFRGFRYELVDAQGNVVPREVMHHLIMVNFERRQLIYSAVERLLGAGSETEDASVPKTIGVPLSAGTDLGFYVMWHNETGTDYKDVYLRLALLWTPTNQNPRPLASLPIYMDVNLTVGETNTYDIPPGRSTKSYEFTLPVGGRLLGVGGHLHDYGVMVRLEDAEQNEELTRVEAKRDSTGKVLSVSRKLFGVSGEGLKLKANHRYRVVGVYDNPTDSTVVRGAMAHMVGLFVPDDMSKWPKLDLNDPTLRADLASLHVPGYAKPTKSEQHQHGGHGGHSH